MKHTLLLLACSLACSSGVFAQTQDEVIAVIKNRISNIDSLFENSGSLNMVQINQSDFDISSSVDLVNLWSKDEKKYANSATGLDLSAGYDRKFGSGSDDPFDEYYSYANRFYLGLHWNILNSGFVGAKRRDHRIELKTDLKLLSEYNYRDISLINLSSEISEQAILAHYNKLYTTKIELYTDLITFQKVLQQNGQSTILDHAELQLQLAICKGTLKITDVKVDYLLDADSYIASQTVFENSDIDSLIAKNHIINETKLEAKLMQNQAQDISYWDDAKIAPYVKVQNYSASAFTDARNVGQVGVAVTLPILPGNKHKRRSLASLSEVYNNQAKQQSSSIRAELESRVREINNNLQLLEIAKQVVDINKDKIEVAKKMYEADQLPLSKLAAQYITLLDTQLKVLSLIETREKLKTQLMLLNTRN